jgi:uncharacterized protein (DUF885 family)
VTTEEPVAASMTLARLAEEAWEGMLAAQPVMATAIGDRRFDDRLPDNRPGANAAERRRLADLLHRARVIPAADLGPADTISLTALIAFLEMQLDLATAGLERWVIDPLEGPQVGFLNIPSYQIVESPADGDRMLGRWAAMGPFVDRHVDSVLDALAGGTISAQAPIRKVIDELDDLLGQPAETWALLEPARVDRPAWSETERQRFAAALETVVVERIRPAFVRYRDVLVERVLPRARSDDRPGLGDMPGGVEAYRRVVRAHTSLDLAPDRIHAIGLAEVERIDEELAETAARALGSPDRRAAVDRLRHDPALHFATREDVLATATAALARANAALGDWFGVLPRATCEVVEMGAHEAKHSTIAYYLQPPEDGSRPGRYYLNLSAPETRPRYEAEALAFHESVPGHHLQLAIAQQLTGLPAFRRHEGSTAFIEGWGLYTERLADEMGLYSGDVDRIGIASFDGWRACRLVVDTGIHALGWSRRRAIEFMVDHTALAENNIVNEVDRYITWPGQALAYKLGQLEIRRLRDEARERLGAGFDVRAFHDAVLSNGALPMPALRAVVEAELRGLSPDPVAHGGG